MAGRRSGLGERDRANDCSQVDGAENPADAWGHVANKIAPYCRNMQNLATVARRYLGDEKAESTMRLGSKKVPMTDEEAARQALGFSPARRSMYYLEQEAKREDGKPESKKKRSGSALRRALEGGKRSTLRDALGR